MTNISGQEHSGYRSIDATPLGDAEALASGKAVEFGGNGAGSSWRSAGRGTLGFHGADLGSDRPTEGRVPAFLGLAERTGGIYIENPPSVADALRETKLDFEVRKDRLSVHLSGEVAVATDDGGLSMEQQETGDLAGMPPRWVATTGYPRDGGQPFAIAPCSPKYTIIQTDRALEVGDALSEGRLIALGSFGNPRGSRVYGAWELGEGMDIGGGDPYRNFVTIVTTHDGTGTYGLLAPIRLGCTNQTNATFGKRATPRFSIRHVGEAAFKLEEARRILGLSKTYLEVMKEESEALLATPMTAGKFETYWKQVWGMDRAEEDLSKRSLSLVNARHEQLTAILASDTCEFGRGTAYAGYQAVVEYLDFYGTVRGSSERRQERIMTGELDTAKTRAYELAAALA